MASFGENAVHAWANINMNSGQTIVNSRNMSSIDDVATGRTRFNFSTAAINNDFAYICVAGNRSSTTTQSRTQNNDETLSTTSCRIRNFVLQGSSDSTNDDSFLSIIVLSDS
jgi:hypothetical protein|tara:strand:- start:17 stop:352 length:336 start_codon:yes stop_codon:yes gene_type:complete